MPVKISKVIKDLNVGRLTIQEYLHKKNIDVDFSNVSVRPVSDTSPTLSHALLRVSSGYVGSAVPAGAWKNMPEILPTPNLVSCVAIITSVKWLF